jgi:hypothetical protein
MPPEHLAINDKRWCTENSQLARFIRIDVEYLLPFITVCALDNCVVVLTQLAQYRPDNIRKPEILMLQEPSAVDSLGKLCSLAFIGCYGSNAIT